MTDIIVCTIGNCNSPAQAREFCRFHYNKWYLYGDPNLGIQVKIRELIYTPEFKIWTDMKQRCMNTNHHAYANYGSRGITLSKRWLGQDGFQNFILDMDWRPNDKYSIDRIDNNKGYCPENCRWATAKQQAANRNKYINNTSGYIGVFFDKTHPDKWIARIEQDYKPYSLGRFEDPEQAALEYDKAVIFFRGAYGVTNML